MPTILYGEPEKSAATLSRAVVRAAELLGISDVELAGILFMDARTVSQLIAGSYEIQPHDREWQHALIFVRIFRALDLIMGHREQSHRWLRGPSSVLGQTPAVLLLSHDGRIQLLQYLESHQSRY